MIAMMDERPHLNELIHAFDYVMYYKRLPMPKFIETSLYPINYRKFTPIYGYKEYYPFYEIGCPYSDYN